MMTFVAILQNKPLMNAFRCWTQLAIISALWLVVIDDEAICKHRGVEASRTR